MKQAVGILAVVGVVGALSGAALGQSVKNTNGNTKAQPGVKKQAAPTKKPGQPNRKLVSPERVGAQSGKSVPAPGANLTPNSKPAMNHTAARGGANDECTSPTVVTGSPASLNFDNTTCTTGTTGQANNLCLFFGSTAIHRDEWFLWTATGTGTATLSACGGTTVDTKAAVYAGAACPPGTPIACNDDSCGLQSQMTFACTSGQQYLVQIGTYPNATAGTGTFTLTGPAGGGGGPANDNCTSAQNIGEGTFAYDTNTATNDGTASCGAAGTSPDVWYRYTPTMSGAATVSTCGQTTHDTVLSVHSACGGAQIGCNDDNCSGAFQSSLTFPVTAGTPVWVRVAGFSGERGTGNIVVSVVGITPNDLCANAVTVTGAGPHAFDNSAAATDGTADPLCLSFGTDQIEHDVWYRWTATCNAGENAVLDVCGQTGVDTRIAVYDGASCVGPIVACNDDSCGLQSRVTWAPTPGNTYTIRLGTFPGAGGGAGTFGIQCMTVNPPACGAYNPATDCQDTSFAIAYNVTTFVAAENFRSNGPVTDMCVKALYFNNAPVADGWVVTVYSDSGTGVPGTQIDQFTQGVDMVVTGPAPVGAVFVGRDVYEWNFNFSRPIDGTSGCVWVALQNNAAGDTVFVMDGDASNGNQQSAQDLNQNGAWESPAEVVGDDLAICINGGFGNNALCTADPCAGQTPANDDCFSAAALTTGQYTHGSTVCAGVDAVTSCSGAALASGLWYSFTGTGNTMSVDLCASAGYDTRIELYCGDCNNLVCAGSNDDFCGLQSGVSTCTTSGTTYYVLVHGFGGATGEFDVAVNDDGAPCSGAPTCSPCTGITIPGNAVTEQEACGGDANGGCNITPNAFEVVTCDASVHGTSFAAGGTRDTDWYRVVCPASGNIGASITADFGAVCFILDIPNGDCNAITLVAQTQILPCGTDSISASGLVPGNNYYVFVSTATFDGVPCDGDYVVTFNVGVPCTAACPCDFNHDNVLNSQDFFDFIVAFFGTQPSADFNHDNIVNSQDFFDFLVCFFTPPAGC
ncbi:MAG: GC-type dockerin domain-anchored protein [Phycisphaerales bacterium]